MANVRVALRVRPLSQRETKDGGRIIVEVDGKVVKIKNLKVDNRSDGFGDSREKIVAFGFDYCYWSVNPEDPQYASQDVVFQDLGTEVLSGAVKGYNICLFAYGPTGSGKTYTMLGTQASVGLTPRICEGLFIREEDDTSLPSSCRIKVSFLEIYNERVQDLLKQSDQNKSYTLRVREHPEMGPYVQGLSQHVVTNYKQVIQLLEEGIANRVTATTHVHAASSRSHAIFTIHYAQAILENNLPSEIASKINLVDLAGSERAGPSYCRDRITEGANINKSLMTLGIVLSTLAQNSQVLSSCQSLNSAASSGGDSGIPSSPGASSGGGPSWRQSYIPYRDSVLTWLLKDSLGGNAKTIMVATVSPAHTSYSETLSTLRYASNAKNIINKPRVNEDANVKLIRELREEIGRLKAMLMSFELKSFSSLDSEKDGDLKGLVLQNELKIDQLTKDWTQKWSDWKALMEYYSVDIDSRRTGLVIDSSLPHLTALEGDVLSTGVVLYHLKEGTTRIGRVDSDQEQDIVLQGQWIERDHCTITSACGVVVLHPAQGARCTVNGQEVTASCRLTQGALITLGKTQTFRFNHPAEAAVLRQRRWVREAVGGTGSLEWLDLGGDVTASRLGLCPLLRKDRRVLSEQCGERLPLRDGETPHGAREQQQQCSVEGLRRQILTGQIRVEQGLQLDQTLLCQQVEDNQQWLLREDAWLASVQQQEQHCAAEKAPVAPAGPQTEPEAEPSTRNRSLKRVVPLQLQRRRTFPAAERSIRRKKATFQLERNFKKQRLLKAQKSLGQLKALCWLQDNSTQVPPSQGPSLDTVVPGPQCRSRLTSCSTLSLRRLCSQCPSQPHSVRLDWDPATVSPPMPDLTQRRPEKAPEEENAPPACPPRTRRLNQHGLGSSGHGQLCTAGGAWATKGASAPGTSLTASWAMERRVGKQPRRKVPLGSASLTRPANKMKVRDEPQALTPTSQIRSSKGLAGSGYVNTRGCKEGDPVTQKAAKGANYSSSRPRGPKQSSGRGQAASTFRAEPKATCASRASKRQQRVLAAGGRGTAKKISHLSHGNSLTRQHHGGDPDTTASLTDFSPLVRHAGEKDDDFSDTNSNYSVDSLSCVSAKAPADLVKTEHPQGKRLPVPERENSESDESQISEDSLTGSGCQAPKDSPKDKHLPNDCGSHRTRIRASGRGFARPPEIGPLALAHKSFSLDSLVDAEDELGKDWQEEPLLGSPEEIPTESFWHLQNSGVSVVDQKTASNSFYLDSPFQSRCGQPEPVVGACYSEKANPLPGALPSRASPLVSMDSWFSCDSKINPSNPPEAVDSVCPSPDVQEYQPCAWEKSGYWLIVEKLKPPGSHSFKLLQGRAELPYNAKDDSIAPFSYPPKLPRWGTRKLLQSGVAGTAHGSTLPNAAQQTTSETSNSSSGSNVLAASAASLTHIGSVRERDWSTLQQRYLLELSQPVLEAVEEPRPACPYLKEDYSSPSQASGRRGDSLLPSGPGRSGSSSSPLAKSTHLRAEKEPDTPRARLEGASTFRRTIEEKVGSNKTSLADFESLSSATTSPHIFVAENKISSWTTETHEVHESHLAAYFHGGRKPGWTPPSDECFFLKNPGHSNGTMAIKEDHWPHDRGPLGKSIAGQRGPPRHNSHYLFQAEKADGQESCRDPASAFAFPPDPELYLHSDPWALFPSSLQPPPLETFYETKSRDALTETALEIPACRKARVLYPPPRKAWGAGQEHSVLHDACLGSDLPMVLQTQSDTIASSQQFTVERPANQSSREATGEMGKCLGNSDKGSHGSISFSGAPNRLPFSSASTKECEFNDQVGILSEEHNPPVLQGQGKTIAWSSCNVSSSSSVPRMPLSVCGAGRVVQGQDTVLRLSQASDMSGPCPLRARPDFICKTVYAGLETTMLGETAVSLKSRPVGHRASSPVTVGQDESRAHKWEGRNRTRLLGQAFYPALGGSDELLHPRAESSHERSQIVPSSQERTFGEFKHPGKSQERTKKEPAGQKRSKRVTSGDEMARLIRSVMQLEHGILEIGSKQNVQLPVSHAPGPNRGTVTHDQEMADHGPRSGSCGDPWFSQCQLPFPRQHEDDGFLRDSKIKEIKTLNGCVGKDAQVQSPLKTRACTEEIQSVREPLHLAVSQRSARVTWDCLGTCTPDTEPTNASIHPRRVTTLPRELPLPPRHGTSSGTEDLLSPTVCPTWLPYDLGSFGEPVDGFQKIHVAEHLHISEQEELKPEGRIEGMGESLQQEDEMVFSTQKRPSSHLLCVSRFFSREVDSPLLSQMDMSTAAFHQDPRDTMPPTPLLPRSYFYAPETGSIFSVDYMLGPTGLKICDGPLVARVRHQDQGGDTRSYSPPDRISQLASMAHSAWCGSAVSMVIGSHGQSGVADSIFLEEGKVSASTTPQDQGRGLRSTILDLSTREGFAPETEATVQRERRERPVDWFSSQLDERVSSKIGIPQDKEAKQQAEDDATDLGLPSDALAARASMAAFLSAEPRRCSPSVHASLCLALLEEVRQAKAQGRKSSESVARGKIIPCHDTILEPEWPSRTPGRPLYTPKGQPVSGRASDEGAAAVFLVAPLAAGSGHLLAPERRVVRATPLSLENSQLQPCSESRRRTRLPSSASPPAALGLDQNHCQGELSHFLGGGEEFVCHTTISEVTEQKKEAPSKTPPPSPLGSDSLVSTLIEEENGRAEPEKMVPTLSSRATSNCPEVILCHATGGPLPDFQESCPEHLAASFQDATGEKSLRHFFESAKAGETTCMGSPYGLCGGQRSAHLLGPKQDHVQCPVVSTGLEEGRASPEAGTPAPLRRVGYEVPPQQFEDWQWGSVESGAAGTCRSGRKHPEPSSRPDQRPRPYPGDTGVEAACSCPQKALDCITSGSIEDSRALSPPGGREERRTLPPLQVGHSLSVASHTCSADSSTLPCCGDSNLEKGTSRAAPGPAQPSCAVQPRACGVEDRGAGRCRKPDLGLARALKPRGTHVGLGQATPISSLARDYSFPLDLEVQTGPLGHLIAGGSSRSLGDPQRTFVGKKSRAECEDAAPLGMCGEPLRKSQDSCTEGQNLAASQTQPQAPAAHGRRNAQGVGEGSVENELGQEPQPGCLENSMGYLPEKPQLSTECRDHSDLDLPNKLVTGLEPTPSARGASPWEEEEQQRDPVSGEDENPQPSGSCRASDEDDVSGQNGDARTEQERVSQLQKWPLDLDASATTSSGPGGPQAPARRLDLPSSGREQRSSRHRGSLPVIAVFAGPKHSLSVTPRPLFSVVHSSRSLQELNLSVEPPSPTEEDTQGSRTFCSLHPSGCCSGEPGVSSSLKASANLESRTADRGPLKPPTLPCPTSSVQSHMPIPDTMTAWTAGTREQAQKEKPEDLGGQARPQQRLAGADKRTLQFDPSDTNPYILPWRPEGPAGHTGWKQSVFSSAVDVSCSQAPWGLTPSSVTRCSSMDQGLEDQNSPFHAHLSTYANARDLWSTHSSTEHAQASKAGGFSAVLGDAHTTTDPEGTDRRSQQLKGLTDEAGPKEKPPSAGGSTPARVDEIVLLYSSASDRARTSEQGTQTPDSSRLHWSCTDVSFATATGSATSVSNLASWASMHSLSLHLSQLLHSTSELLGSLSQPGVTGKEQCAREAPRMDSCTQTPIDAGSQTDLSLRALLPQAPETGPQEVSVTLEVLGSHPLATAQGNRAVPVALGKRATEESLRNMEERPDLRKENVPLGPQVSPVPLSLLKFQKDALRQTPPSVSPRGSAHVSLPPSSPLETPCPAVSDPGLRTARSPGPCPRSAEAAGVPPPQLGLVRAWLVDRASSPILTLSASPQGSCLPPGSLTLPASEQPLKGHQKPDTSPDLARDIPAPPGGPSSQPDGEPGDSRRVEVFCEEDNSPLGSSDGRSVLDTSLLDCPEPQGAAFGQLSGEPPALPPWVSSSRSWRLASDSVLQRAASPEGAPPSSRGPSQGPSQAETEGESSAPPAASQPTLARSFPWGDSKHLNPCPAAELTGTTRLQDSALGPAGTCQMGGSPSPTSQKQEGPEPSHHSLKDLPVHNKFSNWCGARIDSPGRRAVTKEHGTVCAAGEQRARLPQVLAQGRSPEWEQIPLQVGAQSPLSMELTEAKLHRGFGEADALLRTLQSGTGEALAADSPGYSGCSNWGALCAGQRKALQALWKERAPPRLQHFHLTQSLSPKKQPSLLPSLEFPTRDRVLPSWRREYLRQLRKDVVETTRNSEAPPRSAHPPSDIELMLRDYQRAREEAKVEIARARARLLEQTEQEKLRIRQQIVTQLLREEEKLHNLANSSPLCSSSLGSLSSGITSGYNSNTALSSQLQSPDSLGDASLCDSREPWLGDGPGCSAVRSSCLGLTGPSWKSSAYGHRVSLGNCCCSPSSLSSSGTCFSSSSYQDLAKHIVGTSMTDVMAACSDNLHNLFICQAAADWTYQGEEQGVQLYYKLFSSTRHGFLGAGVVPQPLSHVWTAVSDPTLWPLYHKPIQTAQLHRRVTNSISLVYLVCSTGLCALKQTRDFCCVCVEAREGPLSVMAVQSVYDRSMPRPSRERVRGEVLPSAWILQPLILGGKEVTRVIYLAQVELGAPGFPPQLLNSFSTQQPLVIARLASFLGS